MKRLEQFRGTPTSALSLNLPPSSFFPTFSRRLHFRRPLLTHFPSLAAPGSARGGTVRESGRGLLKKKTRPFSGHCERG